MDFNLLQQIDKVKIITKVSELNNHIMSGDWLLLGAITNPDDNMVFYHIGRINLK